MGEWDGYILDDFDYPFAPRSVVVDIGCGEGRQLTTLLQAGHSAFGVDPNPARALPAIRPRVAQARAEALPFHSSSADAVLMKVVLPYTDDRLAISEIARILKPGGRCILVGHGVGYSLHYLLRWNDWRKQLYGARSILNSGLFFTTGKRLPGFWGDTICQTSARMKSLYRTNHLTLVKETPSRAFLGSPVFLYHEVLKEA
jgi:SAM-dependent methyltransferase